MFLKVCPYFALVEIYYPLNTYPELSLPDAAYVAVHGNRYRAFASAFNALVENRNYFIEKWKEWLKSENVLVRYKVKQFIRIITEAVPIKQFDVDLFYKIMEKLVVLGSGKIIITLIDSTEVECMLE